MRAERRAAPEWTILPAVDRPTHLPAEGST